MDGRSPDIEDVDAIIDIIIYRGGDMLSAWGFTALTQGLGLGLAAVALVGAGVAALWAIVGVYLGRWYERDDQAANDQAKV